MSVIKPFRAVRPAQEFVEDIAALPYDVYSSKEARVVVKASPKSFLKIDRAETFFDQSVDIHSQQVYEKARDVLYQMLSAGEFVQESKPVLYLYELTMNGRSQIGVVTCASVDEYLNGTIKEHEKTRADKELDRINHVDYCDANTGPIFLTYKSKETINTVIEKCRREISPLFDFVSDDKVGHRVWCIEDQENIDALICGFAQVEAMYIADGHHRAASAVKVAMKRRESNPDYTGQEEFNYFLSVAFSDEQLLIMDYNRAVVDLNGLSVEEFLEKIKNRFDILEKGDSPIKPREKATYGMFLDSHWYLLKAKANTYDPKDPVESLDVSILQANLLTPILGVGDPRVDRRIDFIGGIRGLKELERRVGLDMKVAFAMYPTAIEELIAIADAGKLMPPKSTWFEPKLRSGLFIHLLK